MNNIDLTLYDSKVIAAISNQIIKSVYTKDETKIKLKNNFGLNVRYELSNASNSEAFKYDNGVLIVKRVSDKEETAKLTVYLVDGANEAALSSWDLSILTEKQQDLYELQSMRYNNNKISYIMGFIGIIFAVIAAFITLNTVMYKWYTLFYILITIGIVLFGFLASEKTKTYQLKYSYVMLGLAIVACLLIFWFPMQMIVQGARYNEAVLNGDHETITEIANNFLGAAITKNPSANAYWTQNAVIRGIVCIVVLAISACSFAYGSLVAYKKTKRLNAYLETLEK